MGLFDRARSIGRGLRRGLAPKLGKRPECKKGMVLVEGVGEVCADDLVLSLEDGQLYVAGTEPSPAVMVWDPAADEWVAHDEYNRRQVERAEQRERVAEAAAAAEGAVGIQRPPPGPAPVFDPVAGEFVTPDEYEERQRRRAEATRVVRGQLGTTTLPNLARIAGLSLNLGPTGIARLGERPAADVLVEEEEEEGVIDLGEMREMFAPTGPEGRAEAADSRKRLIWLALLAAVLAAVVLRTRGGQG